MKRDDKKEMIEFFLKNQVKVHVDLLDGTFLNGIIVSQIEENIYLLDEVKLGKIYLFVNQIKNIEQYRRVE